MNPTLLTDNPQTGGSVGHPASLANIKGVNVSESKASERRKKTYLNTIEKGCKESFLAGESQYPDLVKTALAMKIPLGTLQRWLGTDETFKAELDRIEQLYVIDAKKVVFRSMHKNPYLALDILRSRDRQVWANGQNSSNAFVNINVSHGIGGIEVEAEVENGENSGEVR